MAKETDKILGDIDPNPGTEDVIPGSAEVNLEDQTAMDGGSQSDPGEHAGARDITGSTSGGTESGGTRNFRQGSGHTGSPIGNRPEVKRPEW
jgi:hypothetical protein